MIDREHLIKKFIEYASIDSETFHEKQLGQTVARDLENLGLEVRTDTTDEDFIFNFPQSFSNIYGYLKGNKAGGPFLLSAHLDTVSPGKKKTPKVMEGRISSAGETVLGADDVSGIVSILEAIRTIQEENLPHPDIEVLITTAEEAFCEGSKYLDFNIIKSKRGYVLDLSGPVGRAAIRAPSIISFEIDIKGRAAHAGFEPQAGVNALKIASAAINDSPTGWVDEKTTVNFGIISGGSGINTVPESVNIKGEVRSLDHTRAKKEVEEIFKRFEAEVISDIKVEEINDKVDFYYIPYLTNDLREPLTNYLVDNNKKKVIFSHNDLAGIQYGKFKSTSGFDVDEIVNNCTLFINGHLHNNGVINNKIILVGNLTGQNFNEDALLYDHCAYILTINDNGSIELDKRVNPAALNFYKILINNRQDLDSLDHLKPNAVLSITCDSNLISEVTEKLANMDIVVDYRLFVMYNKNNITVDKQDFKVEDHLQLFIDYVKTKIESSSILNEEISYLLGSN